MDRCQFSEFSFGYCVTEDLIIWQGTPLTAAPVFPSLIQEGQPGYGYDVALQRPGTPLFLQFKLVEQMVRGNANEAKKGHFATPFYRMHLRSRTISDQHDSLVALEAAGNEVFYVAPAFYRAVDLNEAYSSHQIWNRSFRIRPSQIGPSTDDKQHHVTFREATGAWGFYSEQPSAKGRVLQTSEIVDSLITQIKTRGNRNLRDQVFELDDSLLSVVKKRNSARREKERIDAHLLETNVSPLRRLAYLARQFFDCQMLFVTLRE